MSKAIKVIWQCDQCCCHVDGHVIDSISPLRCGHDICSRCGPILNRKHGAVHQMQWCPKCEKVVAGPYAPMAPEDRHVTSVMWPDVPLFYTDCHTDEHRLRHRIRRAFEKCGVEDNLDLHLELAEMVYVKLTGFVDGNWLTNASI